MSRGSLLRLALLGSIWGSSFLLIKLGLEGLSPTQLVLGRLAAGTAVLAVIVVLRRERLPREPALWGHLAVMAVVANIVPFALFGFAEQRISSGLAGVLNGTTPLFTLLVAALATRAGWPGDGLTGTRLAGLGVGFAGVVLVVAPWRGGALGGGLTGTLACVVAAACYGVAFVYTRRHISGSGYSPLALSACQLGAATALLGVAAPVVARGAVDLQPRVLAATAVLGALGTGIAYLLNYRLIRDEGPTSASMVTYVVPVVAVLLGVLVLGEPLTWELFAGAAVVIAGVALAEGRLGTARRGRGPSPTLTNHR